ncbi:MULTISPECIES: hypothetical protein [unclassified Novosphingobium]|uniref:hypothetical protein n=1 Tax=unclassified Novosphingobium TaxID=2644732 RepID=UPI000AEB8C72|nr:MULTISPECIES: hypothetical protein [unclassified Novosphingobium]MBN9145373.1 hypothetical protein [Novosphingobium sp.]MDR6709887.1 hypothetical protein [Novosphingobium sp. 1748]
MDNHSTPRIPAAGNPGRETTRDVAHPAPRFRGPAVVQPDYARLGLGNAWEAEGRN